MSYSLRRSLHSSWYQAGSSRRWIDCNGRVMNLTYVLGAILSVGLLVYLLIALLKAEWF